MTKKPTALGTLEEIVEQGIAAGEAGFRKAGKALAEIRDTHAFLPDYKTFGLYIEGRWGKRRDWAYKQIRAYLFAEECIRLNTEPPASEAQARREIQALKEKLINDLPPEEQRKAILENERREFEEAKKRAPAKQVGGAGQRGRIADGERHLKIAAKAYRGLGPEGDTVIEHIEAALRASADIVTID